MPDIARVFAGICLRMLENVTERLGMPENVRDCQCLLELLTLHDQYGEVVKCAILRMDSMYVIYIFIITLR